jgi:hydroxymethylpyrimidine kinase/phosphomethylpyrimidine kinase
LILEVADLIRDQTLPPPVVDPVLKSSSGSELMEPEAIPVFMRELLPLARLLTPNIPEAEVLTGMSIDGEDDMRQAAVRLCEIGSRAVLIKGGHAQQKSAVGSQQSAERLAIDVLHDNGEITVFPGEWIDARAIRGTGCMMSSAIASCLAQGMTMKDSVRRAKEYVAGVIREQLSGVVTQT